MYGESAGELLVRLGVGVGVGSIDEIELVCVTVCVAVGATELLDVAVGRGLQLPVYL
jgi:hypothetical protein